MSKLSFLLSAVAVSLTLAGCSGESQSSDVAPAPSAEEEVRSTDLAGEYFAATDDDSGWFASLIVKRTGTKLSIEVHGMDFDLQRTRSGSYVFTSGDLEGECDNPGCSYLTRINGVVYLKKVGTRKVPYAKITMRRMYPYPEYDGDLEGENSETVRWKKRR
jgi:hypothetical protein